MIRFNSKTNGWEWLSCFSPHAIRDAQGSTWPTAEHAYQACKTFDPATQERMRAAPSAIAAKKLSKLIEVRNDWTDEVRLQTMTAIQEAKFQQWPDLADQLAKTTERLVHFTPWGDDFWGDTGYGGENHLGKILMAIRSRLQEARR